jgi:hypothetical protein
MVLQRKRTRITKAEIEKAKAKILADAEEMVKPKPTRNRPIILGKTEEVIKVLKEKRIDKEDPSSIIRAINEFRAEKESPSYHLATGNSAPSTIPLVRKSNRITFKDNPQFIKLLDSLIQQGHGVPTIQKELRSKGYPVAYATLGRWIKKRRS